MNMLLTAAATMGEAASLAAALPDPTPVQPPGTDGIATMLGWFKWVSLAICIGALIAVGVLMAVPSRRSEGAEHVGKIGFVLGGVIIISAAGALVGFIYGA